MTECGGGGRKRGRGQSLRTPANRQRPPPTRALGCLTRLLLCNDLRILESSLAELASLFRAHGEHGLADWLDHTTQGDPERQPQRVLEMFTHGMGGMMDRPLYSSGQLDAAATERRDVLADQVHEQARAQLH